MFIRYTITNLFGRFTEHLSARCITLLSILSKPASIKLKTLAIFANNSENMLGRNAVETHVHSSHRKE